MLKLDTEKVYYLPSADDKPPEAVTLGEIVSMMERAGDWRADERPLRRSTNGTRRGEGSRDIGDEEFDEGLVALDDAEIESLGIRADETLYCRELGRTLTFAEMVAGIDPEMLPRDAEELDLLLFCSMRRLR